jgi:hypothetical protein
MNVFAPACADPRGERGSARRRGRPALLTRAELIEQIRRLHERPPGLFRVHDSHAGLYARARRLFGSWRAAVAAAEVDYHEVLERARSRALETRALRSRAARAAGRSRGGAP